MTSQNDKANKITELILEVFKLNGELLEAGNSLVSPIGLTSARWQVMGVLALARQAMTVSQIAKTMGLSRQAVQQTVNRLKIDGLVTTQPNPYHKSAKLILLTKQGDVAFNHAMALQQPWAQQLTAGLSINEIATTLATLRYLREKLVIQSSDQQVIE